MRSLVRRLVGVWLMADGIWTGVWFAGLASSMGGRDLVSAGATTARFIVAALSLTAGWFISQRRPAGVPLGIAAATLIALFSVIDAALSVLPSNLDPSFKWPAAWLQVIGAAVAILILRRERQETM